ncbi:MAG: hypothetical protein V2A56_06675 [bacterium]
MNSLEMIPSPESIPAPFWLFEILNGLLFLIHILLVNVVLGGSLILLVTRLRTGGTELGRTLSGAVCNKLPATLAMAITIGIAPLLFVQVIYGHLFYSSSVLMGWWWLAVIPALILAYYGIYVHNRMGTSKPQLGTFAIAVSAIIFLYISFTYSNNLTLTERPEVWGAYLGSRGGTLLNIGDPTLFPRWLHFVTASVAIGGLFMAYVWRRRERHGDARASQRVKKGLRVFAYATIVQVVFGFWWLIALPQPIMLEYMGGSIIRTILLMLGILLVFGALAVSLTGRFLPTLFHLLGILAVMVTMRALLRYSYLRDVFHPSTLELKPQYGVLALFLVILVAGLYAVWVMIKGVMAAEARRAQS